MSVCALSASAQTIVADVSARQKNAAKNVGKRCRCKMAFDVTLRAMQTFRTRLQKVIHMKDGFIQRYRKQTCQAGCAQGNHNLVSVFSTTEENRQAGCRQHKEEHPKVEVLMNPESSCQDGKQYYKKRCQ